MNHPPVPSQDADHHRVLATCHHIIAGLTLLASCFIQLRCALMKRVFTSPEIMKTQPGQPPLPFGASGFFAVFQWLDGIGVFTLTVLTREPLRQLYCNTEVPS